MCEPGLTIRFCTCAKEENLSYPTWELRRVDWQAHEENNLVIGSIALPSLEQELLIEKLTRDLNRPDAFDAELGFRDGDTLTLCFAKNLTYDFVFDNGVWRQRFAFSVTSLISEPLAIGQIRRVPLVN